MSTSDVIALLVGVLVAQALCNAGRVAWAGVRRWRACRRGHRFEWSRVWNDYAADPIGVGVVCRDCGAPAGCRADWPSEPDWVREFRTLRDPGKLEAMVKRAARDEAYEVLDDVEHADRTSG
jgi:hypothetical protein